MQTKNSPRDGGQQDYSNHCGTHSTTPPTEPPNFEQAARFLILLDEAAASWTFQTFDDNKARKDPALARVLHGTLEKHWQELCRLSALGAGIFITVNETNGKGRKVADIIRVRAVFQECDRPGTPEPPLQPHIVVESSPGKYHRYFLVDGEYRFDLFEQVMARLVQDFGSDPNAKDRSRVLRLPGFLHQKDPANPRIVRAIHESGEQLYSWDSVTAAIPPLLIEKKAGNAPPPGKGIEDPAKVRSALRALDPDMEYAPWLSVGMALHHATTGGAEGLALWDEWSAGGRSYRPGETPYKWASFGAVNGRPVTLASVFKMAADAGWWWKDPPKGNGQDHAPPDRERPPDESYEADFKWHQSQGAEPPDRERPPDESYAEDARRYQSQSAEPPHFEQPPNEANAASESEEGLPADYISAASLWQESFERYWLIERLIERGRTYELFGRYKGGKTLVAIDMVCHLAAAKREWAGRRTAGAFVIWIAGEAVNDVKQRIAAWLRRHDIRHEIPLYIRVKPAYMDKAEFAKRVASEVEKLQRRHPDLFPLLVIDTVARNLSPGCDENSIQGLGAFINNLIDVVVRPTNSAAICIHHPGHGDPDRGRGHSSFPGAVDGIIKVAMDKSDGASVITVSTSEARNTATGDTFSFRVEVQELPGEDNFGNPIVAPVLRYLPDHSPSQQPVGRNERQALAILERLLATSTDSPPSGAVVDWRSAFKQWFFEENSHFDSPRAANKFANTAWSRAEKGLHEKGITRYEGIDNTRVMLTRVEEGKP